MQDGDGNNATIGELLVAHQEDCKAYRDLSAPRAGLKMFLANDFY